MVKTEQLAAAAVEGMEVLAVVMTVLLAVEASYTSVLVAEASMLFAVAEGMEEVLAVVMTVLLAAVEGMEVLAVVKPVLLAVEASYTSMNSTI